MEISSYQILLQVDIMKIIFIFVDHKTHDYL